MLSGYLAVGLCLWLKLPSIWNEKLNCETILWWTILIACGPLYDVSSDVELEPLNSMNVYMPPASVLQSFYTLFGACRLRHLNCNCSVVHAVVSSLHRCMSLLMINDVIKNKTGKSCTNVSVKRGMLIGNWKRIENLRHQILHDVFLSTFVTCLCGLLRYS